MLQSQALLLLGGDKYTAARAIGITHQAVHLWPEVLPPRIADRVQAALYRQANRIDLPAEKKKLELKRAA